MNPGCQVVFDVVVNGLTVAAGRVYEVYVIGYSFAVTQFDTFEWVLPIICCSTIFVEQAVNPDSNQGAQIVPGLSDLVSNPATLVCRGSN